VSSKHIFPLLQLQSHGYGNIDAQEANTEAARRLMSTGLYRNSICRAFSGVDMNSSGLKDDVYDAVVILGGFRPGNIPPTALGEILRITKPGYLMVGKWQ